MAERTIPGPQEAEARRREAPGRAGLDTPPERSPASEAFPWASRLPIGWGSAPARPRPPRSPTPRARKRPAE